MTDIITFLDNKEKSAVYTGGKIHDIYHYLDMIGVPTTLTTSGQGFHHFVTSSSINNDTESLHIFIADLRMTHKIIF